ncbi:universal stress protein [Marivirga harenae]|uniref:universal stress protein n=1 Tax=Marivirga harenae TaxID=2010992 RepID=UPI0026DFF1CF|nr:universal stress protein [Marivirga harenae]WKV10691.1 universal stress protein [Marivirga harenae]|tara:strand:- start:71213 stop:72136 length:924 start_codon:yes stop_codon:yes gene_type:complete
MYPIKKVIIGLDLSDLDKTMVEFADFLAKASAVEDVYFVNVIKNLYVPKEVLKEFPDMVENAIKERKSEMEKNFEKFSTGEHKANFHFHVQTGKIADSILKFTKEKDIDLIVMGRREKAAESGSLAQRLARRAACSLLIIPEGTTPKMDKILVPSDFSEHSKLALEEALNIAQLIDGSTEITVQNVFTVPTGYHYTGKTFEEFTEVMKKNAVKNYKKFISSIDTKGIKLKAVYSQDTNEDVTTDMIDKAHQINANAIIVGAKGRTATTAFFLGSIAERLIQLDNDIPLMIVRPKGKNAGFLEFLKEL